MNYRLKFYVMLMSMILGGCTASFEPRLSSHDLKQSQLATVKEAQAGIEVSVEEYASPNKSRRAFDAEIPAKGVLPLLIRIENKGGEDYKVQRNRVRASLDGKPLEPMYGFEAAELGAKRDPTWNAIVNTAAIGPLAIYFWPATMALSASQTKSINRKIEQHFEGMELTDTVVKPGETLAGFVFFRVPDKRTTLERLMFELTLEMDTSEEPAKKQITYRFSLPTLELSAP
jgi:hypothetical protein